MPGRERITAVVLGALLAASCGRDAVAETQGLDAAPTAGATAIPSPGDTTDASAAEDSSPQPGLIVGEFMLPDNAVVDGDTIRVKGIDRSIRLLSIDSEERIRSKRDRAAIARDFTAYRAQKRAQGPPFPKMATPLGEAAAEFAEAFFEDADTVRLERDDPKALEGTYGRTLAHAFVKKDGRWTSYNVEVVRAGMSPYFTKYGYSQRFHSQLIRAEREAKDAKRGIWSPEALGYGDYDGRRAWWDSRAEFIRAFRQSAVGRDDHVALNHVDAIEWLEARIGSEATVLGVAGRPEQFKGLVRIKLSGAADNRFAIIIRDKSVFRDTKLAEGYRGPVTVRGEVERYVRGDYETLQIVVTDPAGIDYPVETIPRSGAVPDRETVPTQDR